MDTPVLIGCIAAVSGIVFGYIGYISGVKKESKSDGQKNGELKADIEYIKRRSDDTLLELKDISKTQSAHAERLTRVEESAKQAHKRLDRIERKGDEE